MIIIETERLTIREISNFNIDKLCDICKKNEDSLHLITKSEAPISINQFVDYIKEHSTDYSKGYGIFSIEAKSNFELIGICGLKNSGNYTNDNELEIVYFIDTAFLNNGFSSETYNALFKYAFEKLKVDKLRSEILPDDLHGVRVAQKAGMMLEKWGINKRGKEYKDFIINNNMYILRLLSDSENQIQN